MEQTIIELGQQLTELTAEIESWKFWLSLIVGIVAFVVAIGCAIIPIYAKSGVRKGIIEGTQQAMDELKEQELLQNQIKELQSQSASLQDELLALKSDYTDLKKSVVVQGDWYDLPAVENSLCYVRYSKYNDSSILLSGYFSLPDTKTAHVAALPEGFKPSKDYSINLTTSDGENYYSGYLTIKENGLIYACTSEPNIRFNFYISIR